MDTLLEQCNNDKGECSPGKRGESFPRQGGIDEIPHDLRRKDLQPDAANEHDGKQEEPSALGADMLGEQVVVGFEGKVHIIGSRCYVSF